MSDKKTNKRTNKKLNVVTQVIKEGETFKECTFCGKRIGFFRKLFGDTSCTKMVPSNQFCSNKCNKLALKMLIDRLK